MTSNDDLVSIVIPVYNSGKFLQESIESVLNQTHLNIDVIAVDDGSTDNSLEILKKYSNRIRIISQPNKGLASALNSGIKNINGKWFKWFSPDDILFPDAIETLVKIGATLPKNTIIYSNWELIDENGKKLRNFFESNYNNLDSFNFNVRLLDGQQINVNTTLIPTILVKKLGFQSLEDPVAIDYNFFLRAGITCEAKFYLIEKNLVKYRINKNQLSHKNISKTLSYLDKVQESVLSEIDSDKKQEYLKALIKYKKNKSILKKIMEMGLKFLTKALPNSVTDIILRFYLNKVRTNR